VQIWNMFETRTIKMFQKKMLDEFIRGMGSCWSQPCYPWSKISDWKTFSCEIHTCYIPYVSLRLATRLSANDLASIKYCCFSNSVLTSFVIIRRCGLDFLILAIPEQRQQQYNAMMMHGKMMRYTKEKYF
jgi:hypothetical protein